MFTNGRRDLNFSLTDSDFRTRVRGGKKPQWLISVFAELVFPSDQSVFGLLPAHFLGCAMGNGQVVTCWSEQSGLTYTETGGQ